MIWHYIETPSFSGYVPKDDQPCPTCGRHPLQCTCQPEDLTMQATEGNRDD